MIFDEDLEKLEGLEPKQKFAKIERIARSRLEEAVYHSTPNEPDQYGEYDYAIAVLAAAKEFGIDELTEFKLPWRGNDDWEEQCRMFRAEATMASHRFLLRYGTTNKSVALDPATKKKISHWLGKLRELVQQADVSEEKKDRLYALIDNLQVEVDRERTPVQAAGELWVEVCTYLGKGFKELKPAADFIREIGMAIGIAKDKEETQRRLPKRKEPKRIEAPKDKDNSFDRDIEDEIPF
jgi:hypothetical protein